MDIRKSKVRWAKRAALALGLAAAMGGGSASAQDFTCQTPDGQSINVVSDSFIQSFAVARTLGGGAEIAVNSERGGVGLGRQTREWLFERQCALAANAGANPPVDGQGRIQFSLIQHQEADCTAFQRIVELYQGRRNALSVVDRDVSTTERGTYWDPSLGQIRNVSSALCLGG